jgi:hypothetical protein
MPYSKRMINKHKKRTFKSKKGSRKIRRATQKGGTMRSVASSVKKMVVPSVVASSKLLKQQILRNALYLTALCRLVQVPPLFDCFDRYKTEYVDVFTPKDRTLSSSKRDVLQPLVERQSENLNKLRRYLDKKHITDDQCFARARDFRTRMETIDLIIRTVDRTFSTSDTINTRLRNALVEYMQELIKLRDDDDESQIILFNKNLVSANWRANWRANFSHSESNSPPDLSHSESNSPPDLSHSESNSPPDLSQYEVKELPQEFSAIIDEWDASAPPRPTDTARGDTAGPTTPLLAVNKQ